MKTGHAPFTMFLDKCIAVLIHLVRRRKLAEYVRRIVKLVQVEDME